MPYKVNTKLYTVQIEQAPIEYSRWYFSQKLQFFNCILVSKEDSAGNLRPVFLVVDVEDDVAKLPVHLRTIRPEDAKVVIEKRVEIPSVLLTFLLPYSKQDQ
jgi:hypothetical protein